MRQQLLLKAVHVKLEEVPVWHLSGDVKEVIVTVDKLRAQWQGQGQSKFYDYNKEPWLRHKCLLFSICAAEVSTVPSI